ncbi:hypothetical protein ACFL4O_03440 [bacterium]
MRIKKISKYGLLFILLLACFFINENVYAVDMIEISVDTIEIKQTKEDNLGVSWSDSFTFEEALKPPLAEQFNFANPSPGRGIAPSVFSIGKIERPTAIIATLRALLKDNKARLLANPKLATESGSQASFLVGGEIPVPVVSPQGTSIEWKTYGINLQVRPQTIKKGKGKQITSMIQVSVSDLDFANSVRISGYDIPALLNRSASSKVTVDDGGTIVIAGLKQTRKETTEQSVPILSSIPIAGWFFKGTAIRDTDTSMVIFVTFNILKK